MAAVKIDAGICTGCGACATECPCGCFAVTDGKASYSDRGCMQCGHCFAVCPSGAIEMFGQKGTQESYNPALVEDAVKVRRSVRKFAGPLDEEYLRELINKTRYCASACNFRPLKFLVLNRPKMDEVSPAAVAVLDKARPGMAKMQQKRDVLFRGAPHMIVAYVDEVNGGYTPEEDAAIALATIELLAQKDNVGTFWCGFFKGACQDEGVKSIIGLDGKVVLSCMGIGKSAISYHRTVAREDVEVKFL